MVKITIVIKRAMATALLICSVSCDICITADIQRFLIIGKCDQPFPILELGNKINLVSYVMLWMLWM